MSESHKLIAEAKKAAEESIKKRKKTVAVDLDGVIASYDGYRGNAHFGAPIDGVVEFLTLLHSRYKVVIFSSRTNGQVNKEYPEKTKERVKKYLDTWNLPYDDI